MCIAVKCKKVFCTQRSRHLRRVSLTSDACLYKGRSRSKMYNAAAIISSVARALGTRIDVILELRIQYQATGSQINYVALTECTRNTASSR